jgi:SpoVK/Ycf46/Vps4 family AAA+-type ATPase
MDHLLWNPASLVSETLTYHPHRSILLPFHPPALLPPGVLLLAATNRPAGLDPALLRPGRLDVLLYVPPPDREGRLEVLWLHTRGMPLAPDVDLGHLADTTQRFTGEWGGSGGWGCFCPHLQHML